MQRGGSTFKTKGFVVTCRHDSRDRAVVRTAGLRGVPVAGRKTGHTYHHGEDVFYLPLLFHLRKPRDHLFHSGLPARAQSLFSPFLSAQKAKRLGY